MDDIAPELLGRLQENFRRRCGAAGELKEIRGRIQSGAGSYKDAERWSRIVGEALAGAFSDEISSDGLPDGRMYYNIAEKTILPMLKEDYAMVSEVAAETQKALNDASGIHLAVQRPEFNQDRADGIIDRVSDAEHYDDVAWMLDAPVVNFSQNVVDEALEANADFHAKAGLNPKIVRTAEAKCCDWCTGMAGTYYYPAPDDVYRRHLNCNCVVEYYPGDGRIQNAHTKEWRREQEKIAEAGRMAANMEYRKIVRGEVKEVDAGGDRSDKVIVDKKVEYDGRTVYISKALDIKPKEMARLNREYIEWAFEQIGAGQQDRPDIILVDQGEISSNGRYLYDTNSLFMTLRIREQREADVEYNRHLAVHELLHWRDCHEIAATMPGASEEEITPVMNAWAKERLDALGVTEYNVGRYGWYAEDSYEKGIWFETLTEYRTSRILKGIRE